VQKVAFDQEKKEDKGQKTYFISAFIIIGKEVEEMLFVAKEDKAVEIQVQLGRKFGDDFEVISGIDSGESIIDKVTEKIKDGVEVKVL
jgi:hypothetical protein